MSGALPAGEGPARVLVVDDDAILRGLVASMLDLLGFEPVTASTGEEALARLSEGLAPSWVILDMDMPGMGGAAALPRMRQLQPGLRIIIATGRVTPTVLDLVSSHTQVDLLPKPFGLRDLRQKLA